MSRRGHLAPLALTSDGEVLINVAGFDTPRELANLLRFAQTQSSKAFIGVALSDSELDFLLSELRHAYPTAPHGSSVFVNDGGQRGEGRTKPRRTTSSR